MELGLFDEAAEKFTKAMTKGEQQMQRVAGYGLGVALLSMAGKIFKTGRRVPFLLICSEP